MFRVDGPVPHVTRGICACPDRPADRGPGIVRCEAGPALAPTRSSPLADRVAATLPRYASEPHKDPRAPQNLYPIGGLERELRHRLGDAGVLYRALRKASAAVPA